MLEKNYYLNTTNSRIAAFIGGQLVYNYIVYNKLCEISTLEQWFSALIFYRKLSVLPVYTHIYTYKHSLD